jgi:4'-phosphopantetheinyl transferase
VGRVLLLTAGLDDLGGVPVSDAERERAAVNESMTARRFLAARRLVRGIFARLLDIKPENVMLAIGTNGKPFLAGKDHHFSIAHSGETVAVAVSRSEVGVDLETERQVDAPALARRFFSREEVAFLTANPDPGNFFRLWTCREAAVKADGRGLSSLLGKTSVATERRWAEGGIEVMIGEERWIACHRSEPGRLHLALAFRKPPALISWCDLRGEVIL